jgi:CIC family chloride channel protein
MAAMFAGASRALLASVVFAFETTRQPLGLLPLLGGSTAAFLVASLLTPSSIMTEKIVRRGARVLAEYSADFLDQVMVREVAARDPVTLAADETLDAARSFLLDRAASKRHNGFPVVDGAGALVGVVTRADLLQDDADGSRPVRCEVKRAPVVIFEDSSLREAADRMVTEGVGRLVVVSRSDPARATGILTRSDLLGAHRRRLDEAQRAHVHLPLAKLIGWASRERGESPPSTRHVA